MTRAFSGRELAVRVQEKFPQAVTHADDKDCVLRREDVLEVCRFLHDAPGLAFDFLVSVHGVDYIDYFEVVYHLVSIKHNHGAVLKARAYGREGPSVPSVSSIWRGANLQEREVYDLMGVRFEGHPNLRRIMLWEGFGGHPLRKDFLLQRP